MRSSFDALHDETRPLGLLHPPPAPPARRPRRVPGARTLLVALAVVIPAIIFIAL